jgi:orotidine-5'-phosphate decarboxylase
MELCVALDKASAKENLELASQLKDFDIWLKVGFRSYIRDGKELIQQLKKINPNFKIFLDLKLYDIPNTMADASFEIAKLQVDMFNIHASSGIEAMQMVMDRLKEFEKRPLVLSVTALTSFSNDSFKAIYNDDINTKAIQFAKDSFQSKLDGVVCSAFESKLIKEHTSLDFLTLTPGIRPFQEEASDQKRVATIDIAKKQLVDFVVVGRPIYKATNPKEVANNILREILIK